MDILVRSLNLHDVDNFLNFRVQIMFRQIWLPYLVFQQTSIQEVFHLKFYHISPMLYHFCKLFLCLVVFQALNQQVRKAYDAVEWCVHFMTDVGSQQVQKIVLVLKLVHLVYASQVVNTHCKTFFVFVNKVVAGQHEHTEPRRYLALLLFRFVDELYGAFFVDN